MKNISNRGVPFYLLFKDFTYFHLFLDSGFIHAFLRGCKYNLEDTKQRLDTWHSVRTWYPEMFENWNYKDPKIKELISAG